MSKLASEYQIGAAVTKGRTGEKGTVLSNTLRRGPAFLAVEWDSSGIVETVNASELKDPLGAEFEALRNQVNTKLDEALKLVSEANDLAVANGHDLQSVGEDYDSLFNVYNVSRMVDIVGWSSSSLTC